MTTAFLRGIALTMCVTLASAQQDAPLTFKSETNLVVVTVFVKDKQGQPVTGLKKEDFVLTENGQAQTISLTEFQQLSTAALPPAGLVVPATGAASANRPAAAATPVPAGSQRFRDRRLMVLFFDFQSMPAADQIRAQKAARQFIREKMTSSDLVAVMSYASKLRTDQEFTTDRDLLLAAVDKYKPGEMSELANQSDGADPEDTSNDSFTADESEFNLFNTDLKLIALESAAKLLAPLPEKKALIYFSSGIQKQGLENESQLRSTVNAAVRANVSFYPIDVRGLVALVPGGDASQAGPRGTGLYTGGSQGRQRDKFNGQQETLTTLAADTGGKALLDNNDLEAGIVQAQEDIQSYYILGYYSKNSAADGKFRRIQVKLAGALQAKLEYRTGYFAAKEWKKFDASDKEKQLQEALLLGDPLNDLSLALEVNQFRLQKGRYFVPVAVKIPGTQIPLAQKGKVETTEFDFIGQVRDEKGAMVAAVRDGVTIKLPEGDAAQLARKSLTYDTGFTLPPGSYKLKLLARENGSGKMGTFETKFDIALQPPVAGALQTSSVVWASQREPLAAAVGSAEKQKKLLADHPLVQDGQKLIPSITRVFRQDQNLYVYLEAYDAGVDTISKHPSVAATVSFYRGRAKAFESTPIHLTNTAGKRTDAVPVELQVSLRSLQPGRYICQVNVIDELGRKFRIDRAPVVIQQP